MTFTMPILKTPPTADKDRLAPSISMRNPEIADLCTQFLETDRDAHGWAFFYPDESQWESPDCDVMSAKFLLFARAAGFDGFLVRADSNDEGPHWFAVICGSGNLTIAVDWTARQFWNAGHPAPTTDPALIPCPLVFEWPGRYPLDVIDFRSMTPLEGQRSAA